MALDECKKQGFKYTETTKKEDTLDSIVPAGRGGFHISFYGMMGCHCHNPARKYSFLIDEQGEIYKCMFGAWDYASVLEYQDGGFAARFKEFNQVFYGTFISSCASCQRSWHQTRKTP